MELESDLTMDLFQAMPGEVQDLLNLDLPEEAAGDDGAAKADALAAAADAEASLAEAAMPQRSPLSSLQQVHTDVEHGGATAVQSCPSLSTPIIRVEQKSSDLGTKMPFAPAFVGGVYTFGVPREINAAAFDVIVPAGTSPIFTCTAAIAEKGADLSQIMLNVKKTAAPADKKRGEARFTFNIKDWSRGSKDQCDRVHDGTYTIATLGQSFNLIIKKDRTAGVQKLFGMLDDEGKKLMADLFEQRIQMQLAREPTNKTKRALLQTGIEGAKRLKTAVASIGGGAAGGAGAAPVMRSLATATPPPATSTVFRSFGAAPQEQATFRSLTAPAVAPAVDAHLKQCCSMLSGLFLDELCRFMHQHHSRAARGAGSGE